MEEAELFVRYNKRTKRGQWHKWVKKFVFDWDDNKCVNCGTESRLTIDHIIPLSKGGKNVLANLQTLCDNCNRKKGDNI